jgi:hypothetical protein
MVLLPVFLKNSKNCKLHTARLWEFNTRLPKFKKPSITETIRLHRLCWFGHVQRMEENRIPKRVLCMNLESTRPRGRPRNRWQDEVKEDGRIVGGEEWQEKVYNREEWKKLLRTAKESSHSAHANGMNE